MNSLPDTLPTPTPTNLTRPFWEAAKEGKFVFQHCSECGTFQSYPRPWCTECGSEELGWKEVSGEGTVYSYTIPRQVVDNVPAFQEKIPFVFAVVQLNEGPRFYSNVVGIRPEHVEIGMKVRLTFEAVSADMSLPKFRPMKVGVDP